MPSSNEQDTSGIGQSSNGVLVEHHQSREVPDAMFLGLTCRAVGNEDKNDRHIGQSSVFRNSFGDVVRELCLSFECSIIVVEYILRGTYHDDDGSTGGEEVGVRFCHAMIQSVRHMAYLSRDCSPQGFEWVHIFCQWASWRMRYKWREQGNHFSLIKMSQPAECLRRVADKLCISCCGSALQKCREIRRLGC